MDSRTRADTAKSYNRRNLGVNNLVFVVDSTVLRCRWLSGRITKVFSGEELRVRVAEMKTNNSSLVRTVTKLCLLEESTWRKVPWALRTLNCLTVWSTVDQSTMNTFNQVVNTWGSFSPTPGDVLANPQKSFLYFQSVPFFVVLVSQNAAWAYTRRCEIKKVFEDHVL